MNDYNHIFFKTPFTMMVAGPSLCGKTELVRGILKNHNDIFLNSHSRILKIAWCYGQWQEKYNEPVNNTDITYNSGLLTLNEIKKLSVEIVIIDDLMTELENSKELRNLFTKGSHHLKLSVIFITQNIFHQGSSMRDIHLSCQYLILMKNTRDRSQIDILGKQMKLIKELSEAYFDATKQAYRYLLIDFKQDTPRRFMLRTRILPSENIEGVFAPIVYLIAD